MSKLRMRLHFLSLILLSFPPSYFSTINTDDNSYVGCGPHQTQALTEFMNEFDRSHCNLTDPYNGVWCDNSTSAVTKLQLSACLSGTLKPNSSLFRLHHLRYLVLRDNNFISSSLPSEFGSLKRLEVLSLSNNSFIGQVPSSFNNLSMLSFLSLSLNELSGSFPLVRNLTKLSVLSLSNNHFSGTLNPNSSSLFELHNLSYLDLGTNNFTSSLPYEFGNLNRLEVLDLSSNDLFGQVPPTISNLTSLMELYLHENQLTGSFPLVQNLTMLSLIEIHFNHFSGIIPSSLFTKPSLSRLDLSVNNLTGSIEDHNSSTPSRLQYLFLGHNHFEGNILEPISKLINLKLLELSFLNTRLPINLSIFSSLKSLSLLDLSGNSISSASLGSKSDISTNLKILFLQSCGISEFPNILKNLEKLELISFFNNKIKGKVPEWLWKLPRLNTVFLRNNSLNGFEGSMDVLVNSSVQTLDIEINCFEGEIPILPLAINVFVGSNNRFTGRIPLSVCNCRSLAYLALGYNNLRGSIPQCLSNLTFLNLRKNKLEGSIPDAFSMGASLQTLDVGHNLLTGKLPRSLQNCSSLEFLVVDHNLIKDKFPFWLKAIPNLQVLILSSNKFYGPISPPDQGSLGFPELRIFEISDNNFTGNLSPRYFVNWKASSLTMNEDGGLYMVHSNSKYGKVLPYIIVDAIDLRYKGLSMEQERVLTSYATIDFSGNQLEGQIPESIGLLKALIALNFSNNVFTGHIPLSFSNLKKLESLDLSSNQLSGTIPSGLGTLSFLAYINVSHNQLKGEIPQGTQITGQTKSSFEGNAGLCGLPLQESCFGTIAPPTKQPLKEEEGEDDDEVLNWKAVAIGYGPGVLFGLAIAHLIATYKPEWLVKIIGQNKRRNR